MPSRAKAAPSYRSSFPIFTPSPADLHLSPLVSTTNSLYFPYKLRLGESDTRTGGSKHLDSMGAAA